jgi:hypothetical protein
VKFALIEGATEAAQTMGGTAPDRYWVLRGRGAREGSEAQQPRVRARSLFHQSEFEWRKSATKYNAIEKSKLLLSDYTTTAIVKRYQPAIAKRAEIGKEYIFLPGDMVVNGDTTRSRPQEGRSGVDRLEGHRLQGQPLQFRRGGVHRAARPPVQVLGLRGRLLPGGLERLVPGQRAVTKNKGKDAPSIRAS